MFRKRCVRRASAGLVIGLAVTAAGLLVDRHLTRRAGEDRYAAIVAHLDATDPRWRYDEIDADRGQLPDDENSALLVPKFKAALGDPAFDKDPLLGSDYASRVPPNHVLDDDTYAAIDRAVGQNADALAIARTFDLYPRGLRRYVLARNPWDTKMPDIPDTHVVWHLLDLAAERAARDGRGAVALGYVRPMVHVGRSLDGEPFLISALVRIACLRVAALRVERALALATPRQPLGNLQDLLLRESDANLFWSALRGERAAMDRLFANLRSGTLTFEELAGRTPRPTDFESQFGAWAYLPHLPADHAAYLEVVTKGYEVRLQPEHRQRAAMREAVRDLDDLRPDEPGSTISALFAPALGKLHDVSLRAKAQLRCAGVGVAVERFRLTHGRWPAWLDEIPKDVLPAVPLDPFDGKPLKYVKRDDGVTVYSTGPDEQDDGGTIRLGNFTNDPGQDVGFRLYDPDRRGLPAVPRRALPEVFRLGPDGEPEAADGPPLEEGPEPREVGR